MLSTRRLTRLEARHTAHVEALADALVKIRDDCMRHVPDEKLRLIMDDALGFTDDAQWYGFLQLDCGVPAELIERLRRADVALQPHVESAAYEAWHERHMARVNAEIARLSAQDAI